MKYYAPLLTQTETAMGPMYGSAVDNIVQYKVVTADGVLRLANAQTNSDLFFALRGGGGGTWGVVTEVCFQLYSAQLFPPDCLTCT